MKNGPVGYDVSRRACFTVGYGALACNLCDRSASSPTLEGGLGQEQHPYGCTSCPKPPSARIEERTRAVENRANDLGHDERRIEEDLREILDYLNATPALAGPASGTISTFLKPASLHQTP